MQFPITLPFLCALASMAAASGCASSTTPAPNGDCTDPDRQGCIVASTKQRLQEAVASPADVEAVVRGNTTFALDLYRELAAEPGNLFFSPFSISESLAMTWAGARGETEAQMANALHLDLPQSQLHTAFNVLDRGLAQRGQGAHGAHLTIAHALWGQQGYSVAPSFLDTLALSYGAGVHAVDFVGAPEGARAAINEWMAESTGKWIQDLLAPGSITASTRLVISNAVYFSGSWKTPFRPADTRFADFTPRDGATREVPTMTATQNLFYADGPGYSAVQIPYRGSATSMVLILPASGGLDAMEASLTTDRLTSIVGGLERRTVKLALPIFKIESSFALQEPLARLGMPAAFTDAADFSGINGKSGTSLGAVVHQAFVDVDEAGTEAAAAGATVFTTTSALKPAEIRFERPYLFLIRDDVTGTLLFLGRVDDPST